MHGYLWAFAAGGQQSIGCHQQASITGTQCFQLPAAWCLQTTTLDELTALKAALALEREERIAEDDEIVQVGEG